MAPSQGGWVVNFWFGPRTGTLQSGTKTKSPVSRDEAQKIWDMLVREKKAKGYHEGADAPAYTGSDGSTRDTGLRPMLLKEASLFRPVRDWQGDRVWVKRGTKGGQPRYLWLHNSRQAEVLEAARKLAPGEAGIIPAECRTFEEWRQYVYRVLRKAGVGRATDQTFHDLRRTYLCDRMNYLISVKGLTHDKAAAIVAREAGHHRLEILEWYIADSDEAVAAA